MGNDYLDQLGKLAALRDNGVLSDQEFLAEKERLLPTRQVQNASKQTHSSSQAYGSYADYNYSESSDHDLSAIWKMRFQAFDEFGRPKTLATNGGLRGRRIVDKVAIIFNFYAFFFGIFYLAHLGLWKRVFVVLGISFALTFLYMIAPEGSRFEGRMEVFLYIIPPLFSGLFANYGYYVKRRTGQENWSVWDSMR